VVGEMMLGRLTHSMEGTQRSDSSDDVEASVAVDEVEDCRVTK